MCSAIAAAVLLVCCLLSYLLPTVLGQCECSNDTVPHLLLNVIDCAPLLNNSAIIGKRNTFVTCCAGNAQNAAWLHYDGTPVTTEIGSAINADNNVLKIISDIYINNILNFRCNLTNGSTPVTELFVWINSFDRSIGEPLLSNITFFIIQKYPLIATLSFTSNSYPPTILSWNISNNCPYTNYSHRMDGQSSSYNNVLVMNTINADHYCSYAGTYSCNVSTTGNSYSSVNISLNVSEPMVNVSLAELVNATHVLISWTAPAVSANVLYTYYIYNRETELANVMSSANISLSVMENMQYDLFLFTNSSGPNSLPSQAQSLSFATRSPVSAENITATALNSTALQLVWMLNDINSPVDHFLIHLTDNCSSLPTNITHNVSDYTAMKFTTVISHLQPGVEYCLQLSSVNHWGTSNSTYPAVCTLTPVIRSEIQAPSSSPMLIDADCNTTILSWQPLACSERNGPLLHYSLRIFDNCSNLTHAVTSTQLFFNISFTRPYSEYYIQVARVNIGNVSGPYSKRIQIICPPGSVRAITVNTTLTTAHLSWDKPCGGDVIEYIIAYWDQRDSWISLMTSITSIEVEGLFPNEDYLFSVKARNHIGLGEEAIVNATTGTIEPVRNLSVVWLNNTVVSFVWSRPQSREIALFVISSYSIGDISGRNISLSKTTLIWTQSVTESTSHKYTFSIAAAVRIDGVVIKGEDTTINGCYGYCSFPLATAGGVIGGACAIILLIIAIVILVAWRKGKCGQARNRRVESISMNLITTGGKAPLLASAIEDISTKMGDEVVLNLDIFGEPYPDITWYFNDQIIADDEHYELEEENQLLIHDVQTKHAGVYSFTASNALGSIDGQIRVFVLKDESGDETKMKEENPVHCNDTGNIVPLCELVKHVELMSESNGTGFRNEFQKAKSYNFLTTDVANSPENKRRNRFKTVIPYDQNLVSLAPIEVRGDCSHSYINASYIDGYTKKKQFIATQGPLPQTLVDFWRLVWQDDIRCIVMLLSPVSEGGIVRCQQYWPDSTGTAYYGPFKVTVEGTDENDCFKERQIAVTMTGSPGSTTKTIHHYQFNCWPEHGVPQKASPILALHDALKMWLDIPPPILVHCSAGAGPTAVLLAIIIGLQQGQREGKLDLLGLVNKLREQRMKMVQTEEQYEFIHRVLLEAFYTVGKESITASNLQLTCLRLDSVIDNLNVTGYEAHFKALQVLSPRPNTVARNAALSRPTLSRSSLFLPPDKYRVVLQNKMESFIHASFLDGYQQTKAFIVAESPTKSTVVHFWSMIVEQKCSVIVMLCDCVEYGEETCFPYWPASSESERHFGYYRVKHHRQNVEQHYTETIFYVTDTQLSEEYTVVQIQLPNWAPTSECTNPQAIIAVITQVEIIQRRTGNNPILVHCSDTVARSGIFCTLYVAIQQMKTEQQVDIYKILINLRTQKPGLVTTPDQYKMIYSLLLRFINEFETYENFEQHQNKHESIYNI